LTAPGQRFTLDSDVAAATTLFSLFILVARKPAR
jgi:hypothetical protein